MWPWRCVGRYDIDIVIISCLVSNVYFNCIFLYPLYYDMDIGTMWHCALVSCTPARSLGLVFGCALFWCWVSLCVPFTNFMVEWHFIMMGATIIGILWLFWTTQLGFLWLCSSGSTHLHGCFCPWTFSLNSGFNMLPSDDFVSYLDSLLGYCTREC